MIFISFGAALRHKDLFHTILLYIIHQEREDAKFCSWRKKKFMCRG